MATIKKIAAIATTAALAFTLCLGLVGCGPNKDNFTGVWQVSTADGTSMDQLNNWSGSVDMTITLNEDGTATIKSSSASLFGNSSNSVEATWKAASDTECSITDNEGGAITGKLNDGILTVDVQGNVMTFKRA